MTGEGGRSRLAGVNLIPTLTLLTDRITEPLCNRLFGRIRDKERQREWSLFALVWFWIQVILRGPRSLTEAVEQAAGGWQGLLPPVQTSPQALFQRVRKLSWRFFAGLWQHFTDGLAAELAPQFCHALHRLADRFPEVWVLDGTKLDRIAHKPKILWNERAVILPGSLVAAYDLLRGIPRLLEFCPDAAASEIVQAKQLLARMTRGALIVADRLYSNLEFFGILAERGLYAVVRRCRQLKLRRRKLLDRRTCRGLVLEDWLVEAGAGLKAHKKMLRLVRLAGPRPGQRFEWLTNVLDPQKLTAGEVLDLYPRRWTIERMFYDLKVVLDLKQFYTANPNGVAQQVYAAAILYTALRAAQGHVAASLGIPPEWISVPKFFPRVAAACAAYQSTQLTLRIVVRLNRRTELRLPDMEVFPWAWTDIRQILVRKRSDHRRKRRYCKARARWKSFAHVSGGQLFMN